MSALTSWVTALRTNRRVQAFTAGFVIIVLAVAGGFFAFRKTPAVTNSNSNSYTKSQVALVRRDLDGVLVEPDNQHSFPIGVMIENYLAARPQSGLDQAGVVYEALAEGGITRFLAIFDLHSPIKKIGPVRSARPYYIDWVAEYDALYAHAGGSAAAMSLIRQVNLRDLDQFFNSKYYWRDTSRKIAIEHTLFTDSILLARAREDKKVTVATYTPWTFKDDAAVGDRPTAEQTITVPFSTFNYQVQWKYDATTNLYNRFLAGKEHVTTDGTKLAAKNVVVISVKTQLADAEHLSMTTIGSGDATVFRDGLKITGTWTKDGRNTRMVFKDASGQIIPLDAGQTWIEVVPPDRKVTTT